MLDKPQETPLIEKAGATDEHPDKDLWVTTTGLVVHSLAEGVAMGASLYSKFPALIINLTLLVQYNGKKGSSVGLVVALAIFIHKAPEALGFGTFLHHKGASSKELLMHLTVRNNFPNNRVF